MSYLDTMSPLYSSLVAITHAPLSRCHWRAMTASSFEGTPVIAALIQSIRALSLVVLFGGGLRFFDPIPLMSASRLGFGFARMLVFGCLATEGGSWVVIIVVIILFCSSLMLGLLLSLFILVTGTDTFVTYIFTDTLDSLAGESFLGCSGMLDIWRGVAGSGRELGAGWGDCDDVARCHYWLEDLKFVRSGVVRGVFSGPFGWVRVPYNEHVSGFLR